MRRLVGEDNQNLVASIFEYFEARGHALDAAPDGHTASYLLEQFAYDVVVMDWGLPRVDGIQVLTRLRHRIGQEPPVLMLTARGELEDKLTGFGAGANDYLVKPFAMAELEARLAALAMRAKPTASSRELVVDDLAFDPATQQVRRAGRQISLYRACRKLLEVLMRASPSVVSRSELEFVLWGDEPPDGDQLRSHMYELRRAVDGEHAIKLIHTVPREGYRLGRNVG
jgi:DNA-binding response OmpR family regulator